MTKTERAKKRAAKAREVITGHDRQLLWDIHGNMIEFEGQLLRAAGKLRGEAARLLRVCARRIGRFSTREISALVA